MGATLRHVESAVKPDQWVIAAPHGMGFTGRKTTDGVISLMPFIRLVSLAASILLLSPLPASAITGLGFLQGSFLLDLSPADAQSFRSAVAGAMDAAPDALVTEWRSADGERRGKIYPKYTYESGGTLCRRTLFQLQRADGPVTRHRFDLCKENDQWHISPPPAPLPKDEQAQVAALLSATLSDGDTGVPVAWQGPASGARMVIVPLEDAAPDCRGVAVSLEDAEGNRINGNYRFCADADKRWAYTPAIAAP
jgi:surface antigen